MTLFNMSDQQQELYNLLKDELGNTEPEDMAKDIKTMLPGQLVHNIRVFRECNQFIRDCDAYESQTRKQADRASALCGSGFRPCFIRRTSNDNTCEHYPSGHY